jgi:hypothetical protein
LEAVGRFWKQLGDFVAKTSGYTAAAFAAVGAFCRHIVSWSS